MDENLSQQDNESSRDLASPGSIDALIERFRDATDADLAFDRVAAGWMGVGLTDLKCLDAVERRDGLTAGELAAESGLTTGAVTAIIDRLERAGYARRVRDPDDRRRVRVEVTPAFRERGGEVWGPVAADWHRTLAERFTPAELGAAAAVLETAAEIARRQAARLEPGR